MKNDLLFALFGEMFLSLFRSVHLGTSSKLQRKPQNTHKQRQTKAN